MRQTAIHLSVAIFCTMALGVSTNLGSPAMATPLIGRQQDQGSVLEVPKLSPQQPNENGAATENPGPGPVIQIPQRFLGCWSGSVSESDLTGLRMITMPLIAAWLTKQYRVCFEREPSGLRATLADSSVVHHRAVLEAKSEMTPISASDDAITLQGSLRMLERNGIDPTDPSLKVTSIVDEKLQLEGNLDSGGVMRVRGYVKGYYNGRAWFLAAWTSDFQHQSLP